jgi:superfamily II DNA helicase RecQ
MDIPSFKGWQLEALRAHLQGNDNFIVQGTGSGKSVSVRP